MESKKRILITLIAGFILIIGFFLVTGAITKHTGFAVTPKENLNDFKVCLREKDITLYINTNDVVKTLRNIELQDYLEDIKITNCLRDNKRCLENYVNSFPTWSIKGNNINNDISLDELSEFSGCLIIS